MGIDLYDIDSIAADPKIARVVISALQPKEHSYSDMLFEYWRNSILSGISTQGVNVASNMAFFGFNQFERLTQAMINVAARNPKIDSATFGEIPYVLRGMMSTRTWSEGLRNAFEAWRTEMPVLEQTLGAQERSRLDGPNFAIYGDPTKLSGRALNRAGRIIRAFGYRPLLFMDELSKTVSALTEVGAYAYRIAKIEQRQNPQLDVAARVQQLVDNRDSDAWTMALDRAQTLAFQGQKGIVAEATAGTINMLRKAPGGRWLFPFRDTPAAVFEEGVRRLPLLGFLLDYKEQRRPDPKTGKRKAISEIDFTPILARQAIAVGAMIAIAEILGDDDEPWITGTRDMSDPRQRDVSYRTFQPQSIRIGDRRFSYARYEPISTALAWTVDVVNAWKKGETGAAEATLGLIRQIGTKTFLDTVGDLVDAFNDIQQQQDVRPVEAWAAKQVASFVPALYRSTIARGNEIPQARVWGKGEHFHAMLARRTAQQALGSPLGYPPTRRFDVWGRPLTYSSEGVGDFWQRITSGVGTRVRLAEDVLDMDRALYVYNLRNPDSAISFNEPSKTFVVRGETHYLTDDEYAEYSQLAGERAFRIASRIRVNFDNPTTRQIELVADAVRSGQTQARNRLRSKWMARIRQETAPAPE